jgi:hypothetical protein
VLQLPDSLVPLALDSLSVDTDVDTDIDVDTHNAFLMLIQSALAGLGGALITWGARKLTE